MPWNPEHYSVKPKIIHTKTFYCDGSEDEYDQHPRVHYTFNNRVDSTDEKMFERRGYVVCEYCYRKFKYEPEKPAQKDFYTKVQEEKEILDMSMKESIKQKEERTHSEEMQDKLEPIADREDYVNRILKGSG
jgi:uncharacterized Zn-finger protein